MKGVKKKTTAKPNRHKHIVRSCFCARCTAQRIQAVEFQVCDSLYDMKVAIEKLNTFADRIPQVQRVLEYLYDIRSRLDEVLAKRRCKLNKVVAKTTTTA